ncbi:ATP-binding protein [Nonomuraea sp. NPDC049419]|uniref:sensor histidine kinase n=1 Tax=Nonomuraea sp. NPDC049419 TaxID=3155772 RepID=UPI003419766C
MRREVPLRRSLLVRLLAVSVLVSIGSIAATAWLTARSTTVAIRQEQGRALADDARVYDTLLGYAATHHDWDAAGDLVRRLAADTGRRITLTTEQRTPLLDSDAEPRTAALPSRPSAVVDPLSADATPGHIDPRAVGPYRLTRKERDDLRATAQRRALCLRRTFGVDAQVTETPNGRPALTTGGAQPYPETRCPSPVLEQPTTTERRALAALEKLTGTCLKRKGEPAVRVNPDFTWTREPAPVAPGAPRTTASTSGTVSTCLAAARREQLGPYVAPPALLFISSRGGGVSTGFDLSPANQARIAGVAALVLLFTVTATVIAGTRLSRPLRELTEAVRRTEQGGAPRVEVKGRDEIAHLAAAFNAMAERREQLEHLRKAMVSDVAHELRTPLSTIRGWLEATEDGVVAPDRELISSLLEEALLLQHIIDDLQDLAMAEAGELRLRREPVEVADLLAQVATAHRAGAEQAGVTLRTRADGDLRAFADPVRLRQAAGNLVSNAVRHTPHGGAVTLHARRDGDHLLIDVADTGTGIAPDDLPLVFERFWRVEKSRNRRTGGSGLGLPIARKLVEAHGGTLTATSTPGRGSIFTIRLPAGVCGEDQG